MIKMIDEQNYGLTKEVKLEELNKHLRWRCEDYQKRNKDKDIVIDAFGNINCENCTGCSNCEDCTDCEDCADCSYCEKCKKCIDCEYLECELGAILQCSTLKKKMHRFYNEPFKIER